jgi:O-antigen/teichoic acid export membrane protein
MNVPSADRPPIASQDTLIRRRVFSATFTNWASKVATLAIRFFLTPFILHRLGATEFGLWALITSVVGQGELLDLGIRNALTKYVAEHQSLRDDAHTRRLIATSLMLYSCLGLVAVVLSGFVAVIFPYVFNVPPSDQPTATAVVLLMGLQIALTLPGAAPGAVLWGVHKYHLVNALIMTSTVLSGAIVVAVLLAGGGLIAVTAAGVPLTLAMLVIGLLLLKREEPQLYPRWRDARWSLVRSILSFSGATFIIDAAFGLQMKADEAIIGATMPVSAVSPYTIARRLSGLPQLVAEQIVSVFLPLASELHAQGDLARLRSLYLSGSRVTLSISICLSIILIVLAEPLLTLWVGMDYAQYSPIVAILALAGVAEISHWIGGIILQGIARHRRIAIAHACAAVANVALSLMLVRPYGLTGVALGTLIPSTILSLLFIWPYTLRTLDVSPRDVLRYVLIPALMPAVPMTALLYAILSATEISGLIKTAATGFAALLVYVTVYISFGAGKSEQDLVRKIARRLKDTISRAVVAWTR